ncbi:MULTISPECIES: resolvase [Prochlorococcus]|uniref:resolvase n=1 Tax=Prochlorococcus TaxID=1218 RepID=UPI0005338F3E|nr:MULTISPECIES: resolvase [Prochlorococcus]KGG12882.1 putative Helix-turn-helix domain of resolvase [Prochlorococcus sp. MIT 0601]
MFNGAVDINQSQASGINPDLKSVISNGDSLVGIDEVQKSLNRSRASVYRYTNTDSRNLNPPFNPRKLNPEFRSDQKDPLLFHPNEVARFAKDILRIKEVTVEVLNSPSTATQNVLGSILEELKLIRMHLETKSNSAEGFANKQNNKDWPAA